MEQEELTYEGQRLIRIRKQMREQDKARFCDPDPTYDPATEIFIAYVWRADAWIPITWMRGRPTPTRIRRLREKHQRRRSRATKGKIGRHETLRLVSLRVARLVGGAGNPPLPKEPPEGNSRNRRPIRGAGKKTSGRRFGGRRKTTYKTTPAAYKEERRRRPSQAPGRLSKCDFVHRGKRCPHRAFWMVGFMDDKRSVGKKRVVKKRCTTHAWNDKFFPTTARQVVCIQRKPRKVAA
jgi:hypothetical protein